MTNMKTPRGLNTICAVAVVLATHNAASASATYALDDGTGTFNLGPSAFDAEFMWGNYFDAVPGAETITEISVSLANGVPLGEPVSVLLFDDPDDDLNPDNATFLTRTDSVTVASGLNEFLTFDITDTPVSGGFFVAVLMDLQQGQSAARMDENTNSGRSWIFFDGEIQLDDLSTSPLYYNMSSSPFNGTWMIRANGIPEPSSLMVLLSGVLLVRRRKDR